MGWLRSEKSPGGRGTGLGQYQLHTAVATVSGSGLAIRTHGQFARLFVLAQDFDDAMRSLQANVPRPDFARLAGTAQMTLDLFTHVTAVIGVMVARADRIATMSMTPEHRETERAGLAALEARQATEHALVEEGQAAIAADIALLRAALAEAQADYRAEAARQLLDVAPFPQPGSAAAELSILLSSQRLRHHKG